VIYRRILEVNDSDSAALSTLPRLLLAQGDAVSAVAVIEQHREKLSGDDRAEREAELAELYLNRLSSSEQAFKNAVSAVESAPMKARRCPCWSACSRCRRCARASRPCSRLNTRLPVRRAVEASALSVLLAEDQGFPALRLPLYLRLADAQQHKLSSFGSALDVVLEAARQYPGELPLWDRADELAQLAGRPTDLGEAFREALRATLPEALEVELAERAARLHETASAIR